MAKPPRKVGEAEPSADELTAHELIANEVTCLRVLGISGPMFWHRPYAHTRQLLAFALEQRPRDPSQPKFNRGLDKKIGEHLRARQAAMVPPGRN